MRSLFEVHMISGNRKFISFVILEVLFVGVLAFSQAAKNLPPSLVPPPPSEPDRPSTEPPVIKKLGENLVQINNIVVDTAKKEVSVTGHSMADRTLEFVASTKRGMKLYESAIELDTDATTFNFALIMIGLDKKRGVAPREHFGKDVGGDPVEIWIEWKSGETRRRVSINELLYDAQNQKVPAMGDWVYTGSTVLPDGRFLAELDGVLIGFVHDPASLIENVSGGGLNAYGSIKLNPNLNLAPDTEIKLTVKALPRQKKPD
jgi:hypothetical protein